MAGESPGAVMTAERTEALALRAFDYGESSQILHLLTREQGRVHGIAKGARRLNGAFHGGVDALHLGEALVYPRRPGAELRTLGGFATATHFPRLRDSIPRFHAASHVLALLLAFTREEEPVPDVFDLAVSALRILELADDAQAQAIALAVEAMLLRHAGFFPDLQRCVSCERPAKNVNTTRLSALRGGLLCRNCASQDAQAVTVTGDVVVALGKLGDGPLAAAMSLPEDLALRRGLRAALDAWTTTVLDRPLRTSRFL
jgi:DNA repair protein RecO (recombination protein O)